MRIKTIGLSWFRGAADSVKLDLNSRSVVIYGNNGSGKSSFVDAIEYAIENGKVNYLANEYSGRKQENAIPNTHTPSGQSSSISITFNDDTDHKITIARNGNFTNNPSITAGIEDWEYRRTVLRQHEVAEFINSRKGDKYSALLPLLGLSPLEVAAENLRKLAKVVEEESSLAELKRNIELSNANIKEVFGDNTHAEIMTAIEELHKLYCPDHPDTTEMKQRCIELQKALEVRIEKSTQEFKRHYALKELSTQDLKNNIEEVRNANAKLAEEVEPLITEKLQVLEYADVYAGKLEQQEDVDCPACGREIPVEDFKAHLKAERERLKETIDTFNTRKLAIAALCTTLEIMQTLLSKPELETWREELAKGSLTENFECLDSINTEKLRAYCSEDDLKAIEENLQPLIDAAFSASESAPPEAQELMNDKQKVEVVFAFLKAIEMQQEVNRAEILIAFILKLVKCVREEIREKAEKVILDLSSDIETMWAILHPDDLIDNVHLCLPESADKAIDIGLRFHGKDQDSPRLTLSEGCRNSLGLCIFLAMAKREPTNDRPIFLDDVVVSFDREHRFGIADILIQHFNNRQVIILTHDRVWYSELVHRFSGWQFKRLGAWKTPVDGIHWINDTSTFAEVRSYIDSRPDMAASEARKIMDIEFANIAENLRSNLEYKRGDKNDTRMTYEFLRRLASDANKCLKKKVGENYEIDQASVDLLKLARDLLVPVGNRGAHTTDVTELEATTLIDACEKAWQCFFCKSCNGSVCVAHIEADNCKQCECSSLRWEYDRVKVR